MGSTTITYDDLYDHPIEWQEESLADAIDCAIADAMLLEEWS